MGHLVRVPYCLPWLGLVWGGGGGSGVGSLGQGTLPPPPYRTCLDRTPYVNVYICKSYLVPEIKWKIKKQLFTMPRLLKIKKRGDPKIQRSLAVRNRITQVLLVWQPKYDDVGFSLDYSANLARIVLVEYTGLPHVREKQNFLQVREF